MDAKLQLIQHFLAALAYRTQKAVRDAPEGFSEFNAGHDVRTPKELVRHMARVLDYARSCFTGVRQLPEPLPSLTDEITRFHATLEDIDRAIESGHGLLAGMTPERLLQGPLADAMTHTGQLAMLRRLAGAPVQPENFAAASIDRTRLSVDQAPPAAPAAEWPEAPVGWLPPSTRG